MARPPRELTPYRSNRHFYGSELRRCRNEAEMTLDGLSTKVPFSRSQLHRVEVAEMMPPLGLSEALDELFGTQERFVTLYALARHEVHPDKYRRRMELEARSRVIGEYAGLIVPGLLQTEAYMRALFRAVNRKATQEKIEEMVAVRLGRQELLRADSPPHFSCILDEAAVRRPVGGPATMREQLAVLVELVDTITTIVQILPNEHGEHALMGGSVMLMTLDDGTTVACEESSKATTLFEDAEAARERQQAYDLLRAYALSPSDTATFIQSVMEALPHEHHR